MNNRAQNYKRIGNTILLDREEALLRRKNVTTKREVERIWNSRYPYASSESRKLIIPELVRRLELEA